MPSESTARRILSALENNAKASVKELAEEVGVSKPTVRKYVQELEEEGVIVGYSADVDPKKLSDQSIALVGMDVESERYVEATRSLKRLDSVHSLYTASGDHSLMAEVRAKDGDALGDVIEENILAINGITAAHPAILNERLK
ncbi:MAG: winged helix-turn-helix transcriptional regulator [Halobacteriaceae archaeon]